MSALRIWPVVTAGGCGRVTRSILKDVGTEAIRAPGE